VGLAIVNSLERNVREAIREWHEMIGRNMHDVVREVEAEWRAKYDALQKRVDKTSLRRLSVVESIHSEMHLELSSNG
jgi:hypothetical protein